MIVTVLNRARPLVISSTSPSIRMPSSASPVRLRNGSTATRGIAPPGSGGAGASSGMANR